MSKGFGPGNAFFRQQSIMRHLVTWQGSRPRWKHHWEPDKKLGTKQKVPRRTCYSVASGKHYESYHVLLDDISDIRSY